MEDSDCCYVMLGKRYLRFANLWLKRGGAHLTLARQPLEDCRLTMDEASKVVAKIQGHRCVDERDKSKLSIQRITVKTCKIPYS